MHFQGGGKYCNTLDAVYLNHTSGALAAISRLMDITKHLLIKCPFKGMIQRQENYGLFPVDIDMMGEGGGMILCDLPLR